MFGPHARALARYGIDLTAGSATGDFKFTSVESTLQTFSGADATTNAVAANEARPCPGPASPITLPQSDTIFALNVSVGTPPQDFLLSFDTGTPQTWFMSTSLPDTQKGNHTLYDPKKSTSFQDSAKDYTLRYGDGSSNNGTWGFETIEFGGLTVTNTAFGVAKSVSPLYTNGIAAGHFGLSLDSTVLQNLIKEEVITNPVFSLRLNENGPGQATFGYINQTWASSKITEVPVNAEFHERWRITTSGIKVNGKVIPRPNNSIKEALIDSGTTLVYLQPAVIKEIYAQIPGAKFDESQQGYLVPTGSRYPLVTFLIGGQEFPVPAHKTGADLDLGDGTSFGEYQSTAESDVFEYYGTGFLKSVVAVHDFGNRKLGLARRADIKYED